jgi:hypothetical protein
LPTVRNNWAAMSANIISSPVSLDMNFTNISMAPRMCAPRRCQIAGASCKMSVGEQMNLQPDITANRPQTGIGELEHQAHAAFRHASGQRTMTADHGDVNAGVVRV